MIKATISILVLLVGVAFCSADKATASRCGLAEAPRATCCLRRGQIRRLNRRAYRAEQQAKRRACSQAKCCTPTLQ